MDTSNLAKRMKTYEKVSRTKLMRRTPVAIRIDGKAFHTFCKGFEKPFEPILIDSMEKTTKYLCENIQGCVFGYTQSDEITLILTDYKTFETEAWFDNQVQKICSVSASMATMQFNKVFREKVNEYVEEYATLPEEIEYGNVLKRAVKQGAMFDARCFNIPKEEVVNLIYWRQLDASRNSIQMVGQANFSHSQLQHKTCEQIQEMLYQEKGINWNNLPIYQKRGSSVIKYRRYYNNGEEIKETEALDKNANLKEGVTYRTKWMIDSEMPILKGDNRDYLEKYVNNTLN